jgi:chemotaxis protein methyltransferase CheR
MSAFETVARLLETRAGVLLTADKAYLVDSRLGPLAKELGLPGVEALAVATREAGVATRVVEAMLNNESYFFRDAAAFEQLRSVICEVLVPRRAVSRHLRIWSAACSTGQEPYSLAMLLDEQPELAGWRVEIVATDLSGQAVAKAKAGLYSQFEVQRGLGIGRMMQWFAPDGDGWRARDELRRRVRFGTQNLLSPFDALGRFDLVLCRNALMYLTPAVKHDVLRRMARVVAADGWLLLGAAETVLGVADAFEPDWVNRGLYRPVGERVELLRA